jgi:hypothetical protein
MGEMSSEVQNGQAKELWPGAGLWLDVEKISAADFFGKVERRLTEIGDTLAQIVFLKRLKIEIDNRAGFHFLVLRRLEQSEDTTVRVESGAASEFIKSSGAFDVLVEYRLGKLEAIRELEIEERNGRLLDLESKQPEDPAIAPASQARRAQLDAVYVALAVYALMEAAGLPEDVKAAKIAKFISRLAGIHEKTIEPHLTKILGRGNLSGDQYEFVAEMFEELGLDRLAKDVRSKHRATK